MILWERFDQNEWFVLAMLVLSYAAVIALPKRLPRSILILGLIWGFASSTLLDFTIGGGLMDFYRVNDSNRYELTDLFVYLIFASFGYLFVYFYEWFQIDRRTFVFYVLVWSALGMGVEWIAEWTGMTVYQHGYKFEYNFVVFLVVQTITGLYYAYLRRSSLFITDP
ncbi:hypothetical protein AB6A23_26260 [Paenibacillus tarimensis]